MPEDIEEIKIGEYDDKNTEFISPEKEDNNSHDTQKTNEKKEDEAAVPMNMFDNPAETAENESAVVESSDGENAGNKYDGMPVYKSTSGPDSEEMAEEEKVKVVDMPGETMGKKEDKYKDEFKETRKTQEKQELEELIQKPKQLPSSDPGSSHEIEIYHCDSPVSCWIQKIKDIFKKKEKF